MRSAHSVMHRNSGIAAIVGIIAVPPLTSPTPLKRMTHRGLGGWGARPLAPARAVTRRW